MRDAASWAAARAVGAATQAAARSLAEARSPGEAASALAAVLALFMPGPPPPDEQPQDGGEGGEGQAPAGGGTVELQQHAAALGWPALRALFFRDQFAAWATGVLTEACGEWMPRCNAGEAERLRRLVEATFSRSPPADALAALAGHLSAVLPKRAAAAGAATVTAVAAETAADLLAQRFAAAGSPGVWQLAQCCCASAAAAPPAAPGGGLPEAHMRPPLGRSGLGPEREGLGSEAAPPGPWALLPLSQEQAEEAALQLASLPDRAQQLPSLPDALAPQRFVEHVLRQAVWYVAKEEAAGSSSGSGSSSGGGSGGGGSGPAVALAALLLQKFATRGHARHAATALLGLLDSGGEGSGAGGSGEPALREALRQVMFRACSHTAAAEKLLMQLLRQSGDLPQPEEQRQQRLQELLCPLLATSAALRAAATRRLLLSRTLPASALRALLALLAACRPSLLPAAAEQLAQAWCDQGMVLHVPVPQQAYMTSALAACIQRLPRGALDPAGAPAAPPAGGAAGGAEPAQAAAGLLPSVLQGVSARLASPLPAIRAQAMRVGREFAAKLDPSKPLFEDAGELTLLPEEQWPGALEQQEQPQAAEQPPPPPPQQQHQACSSCASTATAGSAGAAAAAGGSAAEGGFRALSRLQQAVLEQDSDDEDDALAAAGGSGAARTQAAAATIAAAGAAAAREDNGAASDSGSEGSASSLVAFDLREDAGAEEWWGPDGLGLPEGKPMGLRALAAALRKQDDVSGALDALGRVEVLVRAEPDELAVVAPELARSLLHCRVPVWTSPEPPRPSAGGGAAASAAPPGAEAQRQRALVAVLSLSPLTAGDTAIAELYSPHLDQHQRILILDGLAAAAAEMADPRRAPRLAAAGPGEAPRLLPPAAELGRAAAAVLGGPPQRRPGVAEAPEPAGASDGGGGGSRGARAAPGLVEARSRVWGRAALAKQKREAGVAAAGGGRTFRNRFAPVAVRWASMLLRECDVRHHGVDLFGRDSLLLGRLLTVLGSFVEAAAATPAAVPLSVGLLELVRATEVSEHKEVFVRRSALVAASQVVRHLPPARLAGAMVGRRADAADAVLVERLEWLRGWTQAVAAGDSDEHCRLIAAGCCAWHVELAEGAIAALEHLPEAEGPSLASVAAGGGGGGGGGGGARAGRGLDVRVPALQERMVLH